MAKPVVAFAHGGIPEIVLHDETGLLVAPGDVDALTAAVSRLLKDLDLSRNMGLAGRSRVEAHFRIERTVNELEKIYEELVGSVHSQG